MSVLECYNISTLNTDCGTLSEDLSLASQPGQQDIKKIFEKIFYILEDTTLLLMLVAVISGGVVIMAILLIILHCRRIQMRNKSLEDKVTAQQENYSDQELWPGSGGTNDVDSSVETNKVGFVSILEVVMFQ